MAVFVNCKYCGEKLQVIIDYEGLAMAFAAYIVRLTDEASDKCHCRKESEEE